VPAKCVKVYPCDCFAYNQIMMQLWKISAHKSEAVHLQDTSSLDGITRQLPDGYYSTFRTFDGCTRVLGFKAHLRRLYEPMPPVEVDALALRRSLLQLLEPFRPAEARVRLIMTKQGQAYIAVEPLKTLPHEVYDNGVRGETTTIQRHDPRIKSTAFISASTDERKHLAQEGIFEALLVKNGKILEGMTSNFFYALSTERSDSVDEAHLHGSASSSFVAKNAPHSAQREVIYTAQRNILLGVTRRMVIRIARSMGIEVRYQPLKLNQLPDVKEAFITSSSRGIVPVIQIDQSKVGKGRRGSLTKMLMSAYENEVLKLAEKI